MNANGKRMRLEVDDAAKDYLGSIGYNPSLGARPLSRAIQNELLNPLSILILRGQVLDNETIKVFFEPYENRLKVEPNHPIPQGMEDEDEDDLMDTDEDMEDYDGARIEEEPLD